MDNIKVSAIVPVYNAEKYLEKCLDSLINQTLEEIEIICVDDGSIDKSPQILNKYGDKDSRINILTQKNKGGAAARHSGLKIARGEYIAFADNDDFLSLDAFEKLYKNAKSNDSDMVMFKFAFYYSGSLSSSSSPSSSSSSPSSSPSFYPSSFDLEKCFNEDADFNNLTFNAEKIREQVLNKYFAPWYKFYKREFLKGDDFYFKEHITYPDVPFHVQVMLRANKISFCPETLYFYRQTNQESMFSISKDNQGIFDIFEVIDEVESFLIENNLKENYRFEFVQFKLHLINMWFLMCGKTYHDEYFDKSKKELLDMNLSENTLENLPKTLKESYLNITNSNSYHEVELLNKIKNLNDSLDNIQEDLKTNQRKLKYSLKTIENLDLEISKKIQEINVLKSSGGMDLLKSNEEIDDLKKYEYEIKKITDDSNKIKMKYYEMEFKRGKNRSLIQKLISKFPYFYILFKPNNGFKNMITTIKGVNSIKKNNLFDIAYYLNNNKDVKRDGIDPLLHYIYYGAKKNLKPNPNFDGKKYINTYKDVKRSKLNPLVHYSLFGRKEGRKTNFK